MNELFRLIRTRVARRPKTKVSAILTSYNYGRYLGECIASVFAQTYRNTELIVVDDGSSDDSRAVIESVCKNAPIPVKTIFTENSGQGSAINTGFDACTGDIIALLDSDDYWYPRKVEEMVSFVSRNPGGGVYQHQLDSNHGMKRNSVISADVFALWKQWAGGVLNIPDDHTSICFAPFLPTTGLAFRREVMAAILPIPVAVRTCPDAYLTRTSVCHGPLYSAPQPLGFWRDHGGNMTYSGDFGFQEFWLPVIMPALNAYYSNVGIDFRLIYEPKLRSRLSLSRIFGPRQPPVDGIEVIGAVHKPLAVAEAGEYTLEFEVYPTNEYTIRFEISIGKHEGLGFSAECPKSTWTRVVMERPCSLEPGTEGVWISPSSLIYIREIGLRRVGAPPTQS